MKHPFEQEYFDYLLELRNSGDANMALAAPYLEFEFAIERGEARRILLYWKAHFSEIHQEDGSDESNARDTQ